MRALFVIGIAIAFVSACGDDSSSGIPQSCQDLINACHEIDEAMGGSDPIIHMCHETGHDDGTAAGCDPIRDMCVMRCEAAAADSGMMSMTDGGGGGDTDGGGGGDTDGGGGGGGDTDGGGGGDTDAGGT